MPLTQNIREADELIEQIIGLDYGRFLRSVMLAQGEFTRFLQAGANERAELLECLTGTEIYSELGTLAHEETSRRQADLDRRAQALGAITLLTEDERRERAESLGLRQAEADRARTRARRPVRTAQPRPGPRAGPGGRARPRAPAGERSPRTGRPRNRTSTACGRTAARCPSPLP